jgi:hypothetical protein
LSPLSDAPFSFFVCGGNPFIHFWCHDFRTREGPSCNWRWSLAMRSLWATALLLVLGGATTGVDAEAPFLCQAGLVTIALPTSSL